MHDFLRTLAITVDSYVDADAVALAEKAARERMMWFILIVVLIALAVVLPIMIKKLKAKKKEKTQRKAERKRIQSKRK